MSKDILAVEEREALRQTQICQNLEGLKSSHRNARKSALTRLGNLRAVPEKILLYLGDPDLEMRLEAIHALANFDAVSGDLRSEMLSHLTGALHDPNGKIVSAAVRALGMVGATEALPQIRDLLEEKDLQIVHAAVLSLGRLDDRASLETIVRLLAVPSTYLKHAVWHALGVLHYTPIIPRLLSQLEAALEEHPLSPGAYIMVGEYIGVAKRLNVTAAAPLLVRVIQTEVGLRTKAVSALLGMELEAFPEELVDFLIDPNVNLRASLLRLAGKTGYCLTHACLQRLLSDAAPKVRLEALNSLCQARDTALVSNVRFLCHRDPELNVRTRAIAALVSLSGTQALPDLQTLAFDPEPPVRSAVAKSLEHLRHDAVTGRVAESILQNSPAHAIPITPLAPPASSLPFPDPWSVTHEEFLSACMQWNATLVNAGLDLENAGEACAVQTAL